MYDSIDAQFIIRLDSIRFDLILVMASYSRGSWPKIVDLFEIVRLGIRLESKLGDRIEAKDYYIKKTFSVTYYLQLQFFSYACVSECNICSFNLYKYYDKLTTKPKHDFFYVALLVSQYDALELYTFKAYVSVSLW